MMLEDIKNKFMLPKFADPVPGTLREILDNGTTTRDKIPPNGLGVTKGQSVRGDKRLIWRFIYDAEIRN